MYMHPVGDGRFFNHKYFTVQACPLKELSHDATLALSISPFSVLSSVENVDEAEESR